MDIKLKSNKNFINTILISLVILIITITFSTVIVKNQSTVDDKHREKISNEMINYDFSSILSESTYSIYYNYLKETQKEDPLEKMINFENMNGKVKEEVKKEANNLIYGYTENLIDTPILDYYFYSGDTGYEISKYNQNSSIKNIEKNLKDIDKEFVYFVVLKFDLDGNLSINSSNNNSYNNTLKNKISHFISESENENIKFMPIKNMTFTFAIPYGITDADYSNKYGLNDEIVNRILTIKTTYYSWSISPITAALFIIIILISILIPYNMEIGGVGIKKLLKLKFEFLILILTTFFGASISYIIYMLKKVNVDILDSYLIIEILLMCIPILVVFISVVLIKHIFKVGIKKYFKENFLVFRAIRWIFICFNKIYNKIINFDIKNGVNKNIIVFLTINLIVIVLISRLVHGLYWVSYDIKIASFYGVIVSLIYSIALFILIQKNTNKITSDYNKFFEETKKLSNGELNNITEDDLGIFNDIKAELRAIEVGFRNAVNEEVKSQKMKTELISNVSHDLKTPLTSIISYIDLLKNTECSEDKRLEYLEILDRKSQRLQVLIEDLFEVSKANSGNIALNIIDVDVVSVMKETLVELEERINEANLDIRTSFSSSKIILPLDSQRIYRVFENLVVNITKYAMKGSRVYINILEVDDNIVIELKNMSQDEINFTVDEIVERFIRGDKSRNTEGSGIGLALAKTFVELQGGTFEIVLDGDLFKVIVTFKRINSIINSLKE